MTIVGVTGDRGLCGSYNNYAIKKVEERKAELEAKGIEVKLVTIGTKVGGYYKRRSVELVKEYNCPQAPTAAFATEVSSALLRSYLAGETDKVEIIYTKFISLISSTPTIRTLLPLSATGIEMEGDEIFSLTTKDGDFATEKTEFSAAEPRKYEKDMLFEQDPVTILNGILPLYLNGLTLRAVQESVASELAARMQAMQSASDNAKSLQKDLSVECVTTRLVSTGSPPRAVPSREPVPPAGFPHPLSFPLFAHARRSPPRFWFIARARVQPCGVAFSLCAVVGVLLGISYPPSPARAWRTRGVKPRRSKPVTRRRRRARASQGLTDDARAPLSRRSRLAGTTACARRR